MNECVRRVRIKRVVALAFTLFSQLANGQDLSSQRTFEVVSVKRTPNPPVRTGMFPTPGLLNIGNYTVKRLVQESYDLKPYQVIGGPAWLDTAAFDISAKPTGRATFDEMRAMVIPMLKDRFKLRFHREQKELPVFALVVAKKGPKLKPAEDREAKGRSVNIKGSVITAYKMSTRELANLLSGQLDRPVLDETGLAGEYQFELRYSTLSPPPSPDGGDSITNSSNDASIFAAIQEQLGLKLERRRSSIECLIIDSAERPEEN